MIVEYNKDPNNKEEDSNRANQPKTITTTTVISV